MELIRRASKFHLTSLSSFAKSSNFKNDSINLLHNGQLVVFYYNSWAHSKHIDICLQGNTIVSISFVKQIEHSFLERWCFTINVTSLLFEWICFRKSHRFCRERRLFHRSWILWFGVLACSFPLFLLELCSRKLSAGLSCLLASTNNQPNKKLLQSQLQLEFFYQQSQPITPTHNGLYPES